nr:MAG TPA: hypothetical protein [Caudoviricetes sp.]
MSILFYSNFRIFLLLTFPAYCIIISFINIERRLAE